MRLFAVVSLIVLLSAALAFGGMTKGHDWGDDFAGYVSQASSLVHHTVNESVARTAFTMEHSSWSYAPIAYPWGFPVLLAPVYLACGGLNISCLKLLNIPLFVGFLLVFFMWLARRLPLVDAALVLSALAFSPVLLSFLNNVLSDVACLFFSTWSLLLIERHIVEPARPEGTPRGNVLLGTVLFLAYFVRMNGLLLVPTLLLTQGIVWRRRDAPNVDWRRLIAVAGIPYVVFAVLVAGAWVLFPGGEASYMTHFRGVSPGSLWSNLSAYVVMPVELFSPIPFPGLFCSALLPFVIAGAVLRGHEDFHVLAYIGLTLGLLVVWPEQEGLRYLFPVLPFLVYFGYRGMHAAFTRAERYRRAGQRLTRAVWAAVGALFLMVSLEAARANLTRQRDPEDGPFNAVSTELFEWVRARTPPDSVVTFFKPRAMSLMTGRRAILIDRCDQLGRAEYIVIRTQGGRNYQVSPDVVTTCNPSLDLTRVFANQAFDVYHVLPRP